MIDYLTKMALKPARIQLRYLTICVLAIISVGIILFFLSFILTLIFDNRLHSWPCLSSNCVENFSSAISGSLLILKATTAVLAVVATGGGILVALWNYVQSSESSTLNNHIAHLSVFNTYITAEIARLPRLSLQSFDTLGLYNVMFPSSREGSTEISDEYVAFISSLNSVISDSNKEFNDSKNGMPIDYDQHQRQMRKVLRKACITVDKYPRTDFLSVETDILALIHTVNRTFCPRNHNLTIYQRAYTR